MSAQIHRGDQTLLGFSQYLWKARGYIFISLVFFSIFAACFLYVARPYYKAILIISPATPMNGEDVSSVLSNENMFALRYVMKRAGVANTSDFIRFETMLRGQSVANVLLQDNAVIKGLQLDHSTKLLRSESPQNAAELAEYIDRRVRIESVGVTPFRRLVYYHQSPDFARYFLARLHEVTDALIRSQVKREATERVEYLQHALDDTQNPEHRRALTSLLLEQERLRMLASIDQSYAAAVIEAPSVSARAVWPDKVLILLSSLFAGGVFGLFLYGVAHAEETQQNATPLNVRKWWGGKADNFNEEPSARTKAPKTSGF